MIVLLINFERENDYGHELETDDRVVDCARLESVCAERHRGFESTPSENGTLGFELPIRKVNAKAWNHGLTLSLPSLSSGNLVKQGDWTEVSRGTTRMLGDA